MRIASTSFGHLFDVRRGRNFGRIVTHGRANTSLLSLDCLDRPLLLLGCLVGNSDNCRVTGVLVKIVIEIFEGAVGSLQEESAWRRALNCTSFLTSGYKKYTMGIKTRLKQANTEVSVSDMP
jgi:hypothetical protein